MKKQTAEEMKKLGATREEIYKAEKLRQLLKSKDKKSLLHWYRDIACVINAGVPWLTREDFTRINNDINGNPRYVIHFLNCLPTTWNTPENKYKYANAIKLMNKIGGKKYHNKSYGGGIVFQSYSIDELIKSIEEIKAKTV